MHGDHEISHPSVVEKPQVVYISYTSLYHLEVPLNQISGKRVLDLSSAVDCYIMKLAIV